MNKSRAQNSNIKVAKSVDLEYCNLRFLSRLDRIWGQIGGRQFIEGR